MIKRYKGQPLPFVVKFESNPLEVYNKQYSDISDIRMNLKKNLETDLDDAYLQKNQSTGGVLLDEVNNQFIMAINSTDYAKLKAGESYYLTLNIQINGFSELLEMAICKNDRIIEIQTDTNRE